MHISGPAKLADIATVVANRPSATRQVVASTTTVSVPQQLDLNAILRLQSDSVVVDLSVPDADDNDAVHEQPYEYYVIYCGRHF